MPVDGSPFHGLARGLPTLTESNLMGRRYVSGCAGARAIPKGGVPHPLPTARAVGTPSRGAPPGTGPRHDTAPPARRHVTCRSGGVEALDTGVAVGSVGPNAAYPQACRFEYGVTMAAEYPAVAPERRESLGRRRRRRSYDRWCPGTTAEHRPVAPDG
ncbi:hypothetical protein GCM10025734_79250 [Kitasatospora paranensis]